MSAAEAVAAHRFTRWADDLDAYGFTVQHPDGLSPRLPGRFSLRATRNTAFGDPTVTIDVTEEWCRGVDFEGNRNTESAGCHLVAASWNAQFPPTDGRPAESQLRFDLDRTKPVAIRLHVHPFGKPNDHRSPRRYVPDPRHWLDDVQLLIYESLPPDLQ